LQEIAALQQNIKGLLKHGKLTLLIVVRDSTKSNFCCCKQSVKEVNYGRQVGQPYLYQTIVVGSSNFSNYRMIKNIPVSVADTNGK
tara:strand:- start:3313 stop:3570 length:258 start_codon:yes stop_codon:yes gene_type:complete